jgi:hypothetical protein
MKCAFPACCSVNPRLGQDAAHARYARAASCPIQRWERELHMYHMRRADDRRDRKVFAGLVDTQCTCLSLSPSRPEHGCRVVDSARACHASRTCRRRLVVHRRPQRGMRSLRRAVHGAMHALQGGVLLRANTPGAGMHLPLACSRRTSDWARLRSTRHHTTWSVGSRAPSPRAARSTRSSSLRTPRHHG